MRVAGPQGSLCSWVTLELGWKGEGMVVPGPRGRGHLLPRWRELCGHRKRLSSPEHDQDVGQGRPEGFREAWSCLLSNPSPLGPASELPSLGRQAWKRL